MGWEEEEEGKKKEIKVKGKKLIKKRGRVTKEGERNKMK